VFELIIVLAVGFAVINGFNDAANAIATVVGTRVLSPIKAVVMASVMNFLGTTTAFFLGLAVARTIGQGIVEAEFLSYGVILAALAAVIIWGAAATYIGLPVSISHSFVAGLVGAGIAAVGSAAIVWNTFIKVLSSVAIAPILGFAGGLFLMAAIMWVFRRTAPLRVEGMFGKLQILSSAFMAYAHGKNDGQMPVGIIAMALVIYNPGSEFTVPLWTVFLCAAAMSTGMAVGGRRVIRTVGMKITDLRPAQGFAAIGSAAAVVETASSLGIPVSTTHCVSSAVMGVGATKRLSAVRWGVARSIVLAWVLTFPICGGIGWLLGLVLT
jgi:PiT family inorganic phosphate transporter